MLGREIDEITCQAPAAGRTGAHAHPLRLWAEEMRLLVHWGARQFMDFEEMKKTFDHTDDITHERAIAMLCDDLRKRGLALDEPTDPMNDRGFVRLVAQVYDIGVPANIPPDAVDVAG
jgi:hypothetical protein